MKVLHLEDNPLDAALTRELFREEWPECDVDLVDNREDFIARLKGEFDVVLSDFSMASFDGLEALQLVRERAPDVPFIFLSGTIGEERALEALRAGASDYLIKDRPKRLVPAIRRALSDAKLQKERRAAVEQMLRVQRLENLGMLAAGIAHDFNNVLAPVLMATSLLRARLPDEADQRIVAMIESSASRGVGLVRQILGFANGVTGEMQVIQSKQLLKDLVDMMRQTFPKTVNIRDEVPPELWPVRANLTQIHQVLLNLCVNARDAMPKGGSITLRATNHTLDEVAAAAIPKGRPGKYVRLEVSDTGSGIPSEILDRIWEPFFTTKELGRGTGLGLSTVRNIVESHSGFIAVYTHAGRGTTFEILLPAESHEAASGGASIPHETYRGQGELVLVADDDVSVREITCAALADHGYRVLAASDGAEALALVAPRSLEVRVVVLDFEMPNLDGAAVAKVVAALNPAIRILVMAASASEEQLRRQLPHGGVFLAKPFNADTLLSTVYHLLHKAPPAIPAVPGV